MISSRRGGGDRAKRGGELIAYYECVASVQCQQREIIIILVVVEAESFEDVVTQE